MGEDITYSGTASACMEAVLQGVPAIAVSQVCKKHCKNIDIIGYELAKDSIYRVVKNIFENQFPLPERKFLNINIPPISKDKCKGIKITRAGNRIYANNAEVHYNPRGVEYYWIGLPNLEWKETTGHITDFEAVSQNFVSITPIHLDMTSYEDIKRLEEWV